MSLRDQVELELIQLNLSGNVPAQVHVADSTGLSIALDVTALDSMSIEFLELALFVPHLQKATFAVLKQWSIDLSQRITYLLENIGPLEFDPAAGQVLIRSTPPGQHATGTQFFEIILSSTGNGTFTLRRFRTVQGTPGRDQVAMQMTTEVLYRLIDDLLDTIP